jgi:hypothetical protein
LGRHSTNTGWVRILFAGALAAILLFARHGRGDEVVVPVNLQAELVAKVAAYDKSLPTRAGDRVHVLIVVKAKDDGSGRFAKHLESALGGIDRIGGLPHDEAIVTYSNARALADLCRAKRAAIVYLAPGLGEEAAQIRGALEGVSVLSVSAVAGDVQRGIVLGFDLVSGKPKIVVHLAQAKKQDVQFKAELLKLARVIE